MREEQLMEVPKREEDSVDSTLSSKSDGSTTVVDALKPPLLSQSEEELLQTGKYEKNNMHVHKTNSSRSKRIKNQKHANNIETESSDVENDSIGENGEGTFSNNVCESSHSSSSSSTSSIVSEADMEGMVTVVQDASTYDAHLTRKNRDAKWVKGLSPEDELREKIALQQEYKRRARNLAEQLQRAAQCE